MRFCAGWPTIRAGAPFWRRGGRRWRCGRPCMSGGSPVCWRGKRRPPCPSAATRAPHDLGRNRLEPWAGGAGARRSRSGAPGLRYRAGLRCGGLRKRAHAVARVEFACRSNHGSVARRRLRNRRASRRNGDSSGCGCRLRAGAEHRRDCGRGIAWRSNTGRWRTRRTAAEGSRFERRGCRPEGPSERR